MPPFATAPALIYVAILMARGLAELDWDDLTETAPALICALAMPLTFSIAHGIAFGFIAYAGIKLLAGRWREIPPAVAVMKRHAARRLDFELRIEGIATSGDTDSSSRMSRAPRTLGSTASAATVTVSPSTTEATSPTTAETVRITA